MMKYLIIPAILLLSGTADRAGPEPRQRPGPDKDRLLVTLCLVPEMGQIAELDSWSRCEPEALKEQTAAAGADWEKKRMGIEKLLTPDVVRALSGWARPQMKQYRKVPSLERLQLEPVRANQDQTMLVLEATVDTLPTHSPLVTRWLKVYLLYDVPGKSIDRVIITVRGQVLE